MDHQAPLDQPSSSQCGIALQLHHFAQADDTKSFCKIMLTTTPHLGADMADMVGKLTSNVVVKLESPIDIVLHPCSLSNDDTLNLRELIDSFECSSDPWLASVQTGNQSPKLAQKYI